MHHRTDYDFDVISGPSTRPPAPPVLRPKPSDASGSGTPRPPDNAGSGGKG